MDSQSSKKSNQIKALIRDLLLLPGKGLSADEFFRLEGELRREINILVLDPYWSDYIFHPRKHGLSDCMVVNEQGTFEINEHAIDRVIKKLESYTPIAL